MMCDREAKQTYTTNQAKSKFGTVYSKPKYNAQFIILLVKHIYIKPQVILHETEQV